VADRAAAGYEGRKDLGNTLADAGRFDKITARINGGRTALTSQTVQKTPRLMGR